MHQFGRELPIPGQTVWCPSRASYLSGCTHFLTSTGSRCA